MDIKESRRSISFASSSRLRASLAVALGCLLLAGCSPSSSRTADTTLRIIIGVEPSTLNPILQHNTIENFVDGLIFDELVTLDSHEREIPDLATVVPSVQNGGISRNGLTITYHLRHGVLWQDGAPFTSADVAFTWRAIMDGANPVLSRQGYDEVASIETRDAHTVVLHMRRPFPPIVETFFSESATPYRILPEHLLSRSSNLGEVAFNAAPVGTGPFRLASWRRGDEIVLSANRSYFRGAPRVARIVLYVVSNPQTTVAMMRTGAADLAVEVPPLFYHLMVGEPGIVGHQVTAPAWVELAFNTSRPVLRDVRVRRALSFAIDRAALIRGTAFGTARVARGDLTPFSWAFDPRLRPVAYDPARSESLLRAAGWSRGMLTLELAYSAGSASALALAEELQQQLRAVGVELRLKPYAAAQLFAAASGGGVLARGTFDTALITWTDGADPDDSALWLCSTIPPGGDNVTRYCSKPMDSLQQVALSSFDRAVRKRAYDEIEQLLLRDQPAAFLADTSMLYVLSPRLRGFAPNGISEGWNAQEWSLRQGTYR